MTDETAAVRLPGGFVTDVVRIGDTVRRRPGDRAAFVHDLLVYFGQCGFAGAPRFLGLDTQGRETLSYLDGHVAWETTQPASVSSHHSLARVAALIREFHDLTAGTRFAGDADVVCHNDLSPKNTVYRDTGAGLRPVAFLDWDTAAPGNRIHDIAHACWQYVGLGPDCDVTAAGQAVRVMCDSYRLADRSHVVVTVLWWQDRCWRGIERAAAAGDPAMMQLRDSGVVTGIRAAYDWVSGNAETLRAALTTDAAG